MGNPAQAADNKVNPDLVGKVVASLRWDTEVALVGVAGEGGKAKVDPNLRSGYNIEYLVESSALVIQAES